MMFLFISKVKLPRKSMEVSLLYQIELKTGNSEAASQWKTRNALIWENCLKDIFSEK